MLQRSDKIPQHTNEQWLAYADLRNFMTRSGYFYSPERAERHQNNQLGVHYLYEVGARLINSGKAYGKENPFLAIQADSEQDMLQLLPPPEETEVSGFLQGYYRGLDEGTKQAIFVIKVALDHISAEHILDVYRKVNLEAMVMTVLTAAGNANAVNLPNQGTFINDHSFRELLRLYIENNMDRFAKLVTVTEGDSFFPNDSTQEPIIIFGIDRKYLVAAKKIMGRQFANSLATGVLEDLGAAMPPHPRLTITLPPDDGSSKIVLTQNDDPNTMLQPSEGEEKKLNEQLIKAIKDACILVGAEIDRIQERIQMDESKEEMSIPLYDDDGFDLICAIDKDSNLILDNSKSLLETFQAGLNAILNVNSQHAENETVRSRNDKMIDAINDLIGRSLSGNILSRHTSLFFALHRIIINILIIVPVLGHLISFILKDKIEQSNIGKPSTFWFGTVSFFGMSTHRAATAGRVKELLQSGMRLSRTSSE